MGVSSTITQIGFFLLAFILYLAFVYFTRSSVCSFDTSNSSKTVVIFVAIIYTLALFGYIKIFKPFSAEHYQYQKCKGSGVPCTCGKGNDPWEISAGKLCRGGPYTWQGNSPRAKMCRQLASTQKGRDEINRYDCGAGYTGMPGGRFRFTPISNDFWNNTRCDQASSCNVEDNGIF